MNDFQDAEKFIGVEDLEKMTEYFWLKRKNWEKERNRKNMGLGDFWDLYLAQAKSQTETEACPFSLLELEMAYANTQQEVAGNSRLPVLHRNTTLVILVGESLEPLLQSIWAHNPKRLIPVVNETYPLGIDGKDHWENIQGLLKSMLKRPSRNGEWQLTPDTLPQIQKQDRKSVENVYTPVLDDPEKIFRYLQNKLRADLLDSGCRVVVDITGAKKTMVAGAFMLAAYSDTRICYIDTERYCEDSHFYGRAYGFSCHFRTVTNPVKKLSLQNWDKLGELYDQYNFSSALNLLPNDQAFPEVKDLRHFLCMCHYWEIGQLTLAWQEAEQLPDNLKPHIPLAVEKLHTCWPQPKSNDKEEPKLNATQESSTDTLFSGTENVVIYAYDELQRIYRLKSMKKNYRDAFSRAYAVYETLFKARVINLYMNNQIQVLPMKWNKQTRKNIPLDENVIPQLAVPEQPWYENGLKACLHMQSDTARDMLREKEIVAKWEKGCFQMRWTATNSMQPLAEELNPGKVLRDKRNEITHTYMPVIEDDVDKVIKLTQLNFDNYLREWVNWSDAIDLDRLDKKKSYQVPNWESLQKICNLHFIPVASREDEGDDAP